MMNEETRDLVDLLKKHVKRGISPVTLDFAHIKFENMYYYRHKQEYLLALQTASIKDYDKRKHVALDKYIGINYKSE